MIANLIDIWGLTDVATSDLIPAATSVTVAGIIGLSVIIALFIGGILWRRR